MNRGVLQSTAAVQQNWWSVNGMRPPPLQQHQAAAPPFIGPPSPSAANYVFPPPSSSSLLDELAADHQSLSQLLLGGLQGCDQKGGTEAEVKRERGGYDLLDQLHDDEHHQTVRQAWSDQLTAANDVSTNLYEYSNSCHPKLVGIRGSMLDFSGIHKPHHHPGIRHPPPDASPSSECTIGSGGGALKRARVQPASSTHSPFKVRKEKLGDRITALHQLVSPFGKTDTASVLLEAVGYIRFLQNQIEALSSPYLGSASAANKRRHHSVHGDRNCRFPEHPGQLLNENVMKKKEVAEQGSEYAQAKDLRSRGLCLVPVSCTLPVGSENGADFWAPAALGSGCGGLPFNS